MFILSSVIMGIIMLPVIPLNIVILNIVMLSIIILPVVMLTAIMLSVTALLVYLPRVLGDFAGAALAVELPGKVVHQLHGGGDEEKQEVGNLERKC